MRQSRGKERENTPPYVIHFPQLFLTFDPFLLRQIWTSNKSKLDATLYCRPFPKLWKEREKKQWMLGAKEENKLNRKKTQIFRAIKLSCIVWCALMHLSKPTEVQHENCTLM